MTLVVNLYSGPGAGKSTTALGVTHHLKLKHKDVEYVPEVAKEMTWEGRNTPLGFQPYVIGKQMYKIWRLFGKVDVVITDSPILLGCVYAPEGTPPSFYAMLHAYHAQWNTLDIFLERGDRPYNESGRSQTRDRAVALDEQILIMLAGTEASYYPVSVYKETVADVLDLIYERTGW